MGLREEEVEEEEEECNSDLSHLVHTGQCLSHSHPCWLSIRISIGSMGN